MLARHPDRGAKAFLLRTLSAQLHLFGCFAALVGLAALLQATWRRPEISHFWACLVFGGTSVFVFAASTLCHFVADGFRPSKELDRRLEDLDHIAIFLFIAGSYTPVLLNVISPPWNWILLAAIWTMGVGGVAYTFARPKLPRWAQHRYVNTSLFVLMGWVLIARCGEAFERMTTAQSQLLFAGGVFYSVGAVIYAREKPNPFPGVFGYHEIWHCLVLLGFAHHYFMILSFYR